MLESSLLLLFIVQCIALTFFVILALNFLLFCVCIYANTRRNTGRRVGEAAAGGNQASPQAPAAGAQVPFNPVALTYREVRVTLVHMDQAITTQA